MIGTDVKHFPLSAKRRWARLTHCIGKVENGKLNTYSYLSSQAQSSLALKKNNKINNLT